MSIRLGVWYDVGQDLALGRLLLPAAIHCYPDYTSNYL